MVRHHIDPYGRSYVVSTSYGAPNKETEETYKSNIDESLSNVILEHNKLVSDNGKALDADQAEKLWNVLCPGYGAVSVHSLGQWLYDVGNYNSPMFELESLLGHAGHVYKDQFINALSEPAEDKPEEVPKEEKKAAEKKESAPEKEEKPVEAPTESLKKPVPEENDTALKDTAATTKGKKGKKK